MGERTFRDDTKIDKVQERTKRMERPREECEEGSDGEVSIEFTTKVLR